VTCLRCLKCLIALVLNDVDLPYCTSKVEHIVAFTAIFNNICTAHPHKRLFKNFRCKFRHRCSIPRPRFPVRVQNFTDLATFSVDFAFYMLKVRHISTPGLFGPLTRKYTTGVDTNCDKFHHCPAWNRLPTSICRTELPRNCFSRELKTFYLRRARQRHQARS